jgi:hypothetical protein
MWNVSGPITRLSNNSVQITYDDGDYHTYPWEEIEEMWEKDEIIGVNEQ